MTDPTEIPPPRTAQTLEQRYGTHRPRRRVLVGTLAVLLAGTLLGWAVWASWPTTDRAIDADVAAYDVVSAHEVRVKVAVHGDDRADGSCLLRATASDHTIVGELNVTADELRAARRTWITIRTERRATTATLVRCDD